MLRQIATMPDADTQGRAPIVLYFGRQLHAPKFGASVGLRKPTGHCA